MSSLLWSALEKLDASVQNIQSQVGWLRAALEIDENQLSHSLTEARHNVAMLRDLVRAERPDATWSDRADLEMLIHELELAAQARRNQQRRTKLLELAAELEAGRVKHRFEARSSALNTLRVEAVKQLRTEAARSDQEKELPGPDAGEWVHWACNLQESTDSMTLTELHRDFPALDRFAGEMEESYWIPGDRSRPAAETVVRPINASPKSVTPITQDRRGVGA